jgi:amidohydrolase
VIADKAVFSGTVRTLDPESRELMERELKSIVDGVCSALHAKADIKFVRGYPSVSNHEKETELFMKVASNDLGPDKVVEVLPVMAGEDFAYYLQRVPGVFFFTGAGQAESAANYPHHHPRFDFDERAMLIAGKTMLSLVYDYLNEQFEKE